MRRSPSVPRASASLCSSFCRCSSAATVARASSTASTRSSETAPGLDAPNRATTNLRSLRELCRSWLDLRPVELALVRRDRRVAIKSVRLPRKYMNQQVSVYKQEYLSSWYSDGNVRWPRRLLSCGESF